MSVLRMSSRSNVDQRISSSLRGIDRSDRRIHAADLGTCSWVFRPMKFLKADFFDKTRRLSPVSRDCCFH
jgi:hypothetical protein